MKKPASVYVLAKPGRGRVRKSKSLKVHHLSRDEVIDIVQKADNHAAAEAEAHSMPGAKHE